MTKDCGKHGYCKESLIRLIFGIVVTVIVVILLVTLIVWLVIRPTKPAFVLQNLSILNFNLTYPNLLTSTMAVTVASRNQMERVGIYYDHLEVYASYMGQQITLRTVLYPVYEGHLEVNVWSPFLVGNSVPVAPYLAAALSQAQNSWAGGTVNLQIVISGWLRWKVGLWISGNYHINVDCNAPLAFAAKNAPLVLMSPCHVDV